MDHEDGRLLWPWKQCDLLIIDDVDAGVTTATGAIQLVEPADLERAMTAGGASTPLAWLGERRSVWVLGDATQAGAWKTVIARLMRIDEGKIATVELQPPPVSAVGSVSSG